MDKAEALIKATQYITLIQPDLNFSKAYLFGSHARGDAPETSDIDIGIFIDEPEVEYLAILKKLYHARRSVDIRIEPHLFFTGTEASGFHEIVSDTGILLVKQ